MSRIVTVEGAIEPSDLGFTSAHEHCLIDLEPWLEQPETVSERVLAEAKVDLTNIGLISRRFFLNADNMRLFDADAAVAELRRYRAAGGDAIVDLTSVGIGRDGWALRAIAIESGVTIVAGCGYYIQKAHPESVSKASIEEIYDEIMRDLTVGMGETSVRSGVIGEIGTSEEITPDEEKVLRAAGRAQRESGAGVNVHTYLWSQRGLEALDILVSEGADATKVAISHLDHGNIDIDYQLALASRGAYLEYDGFGKEYYFDARSWFPRDTERVTGIMRLLSEGLRDQILLGCDVCAKLNLVRYGGTGYEHLPRNVVPMLTAAGVCSDDLSAILVDNPRRFLAIED